MTNVYLVTKIFPTVNLVVVVNLAVLLQFVISLGNVFALRDLVVKLVKAVHLAITIIHTAFVSKLIIARH